MGGVPRKATSRGNVAGKTPPYLVATNGAEEGIRTLTDFTPAAFETAASTNSATSAEARQDHLAGGVQAPALHILMSLTPNFGGRTIQLLSHLFYSFRRKISRFTAVEKPTFLNS